jgi:hypothetical protein
MFLFLILQRKGQRRKRQPEHISPKYRPHETPFILEKCPGQNTIRIPIGTCECKQGYPYGDPNDERGCWRCVDECAPGAECAFPGVCACPEGYLGDGKTKCEQITPIIYRYFPREGIADTTVNISYFYENSTKYTGAYCRFGSIPVGTIELASNYMLCKAPPGKPGIVPLSISFDAAQWSKEDVTFLYKEKHDPISFLPFLVLSLVVTLAGVVSAGKIGKYMSKKNDDEKRPFILGGHEKRRAPYEQITKRRFDSI